MRRPSRVRSARGVSNGASGHPGIPPVMGISPTDHRNPMGPPPLDFSFPTTPAQWYPSQQESPHPDSVPGSVSAGGGPPGSNGDHGQGPYVSYGSYPPGHPGHPGPPGPSQGPPPPSYAPHAQESFIRRDGGDGGVGGPVMRNMGMWSGPPGTAPAPQEYQ